VVRHFLRDDDLTPDEQLAVLDLVAPRSTGTSAAATQRVLMLSTSNTPPIASAAKTA
jgi:hypothetical protein